VQQGRLLHFDLDYRGTNPPYPDGNDQTTITVRPGTRLTLYFYYKEGNSGDKYIIRVYAEWDKSRYIANSDGDESYPESGGMEIGGFRWDKETYTVPTVPGTYKVRVVYANGRAPTWDDYDRLLAEGVVIVLSSPSGDNYEPDNSRNQAKSISINEQQRHTINPAGDIDWVKFTLTQTCNVIIETFGGSNIDTVIYLYDASGRQLASDDDSGSGYCSRISMRLSPGTYYVKIRAYSSSATFSYSIKVSASSCEYSPGVQPLPVQVISISDVAVSSRVAYFVLKLGRYSDLVSYMKRRIENFIGPGLKAIYIHSFSVTLEASRDTQIILVPLVEKPSVGKSVAVFATEQLIKRVPYVDIAYDILKLMLDIAPQRRYKIVNKIILYNDYRLRGIDNVIMELEGMQDSYIVQLSSQNPKSSWQIEITIEIKYSLDYSGTTIPGMPPGQELTWTYFERINIKE